MNNNNIKYINIIHCVFRNQLLNNKKKNKYRINSD